MTFEDLKTAEQCASPMREIIGGHGNQRPIIAQPGPSREKSHGADDFRHLLQIGDQIGTISSVRHSRVGHAVGRHRRLGMGDEGVEGFRRPRDAIYKRLEKRGRALLLCLLCAEAEWLILVNAWLRLERAYLKLRLFLRV